MTDRKQLNKYYPPDFDPSKGSLNTQLGQHHLRQRANRLSEGILVVRFELPYNGWCLTCGCHIGKGVRFNADKQQVGMYFTTKIWQFTMTCHQCKGKMVVRTDPKTSQYIMHEGIRGKVESFSADANGTIELLDSEDRERMKIDPLFKLEHGESDKSKAADAHARINQLYTLHSRRLDDFGANQALRRANREAKKAAAGALAAGAAKGLPFALVHAKPNAVEQPEEDAELERFRKRKAIVDHVNDKRRERKKIKSTQTITNTSQQQSTSSHTNAPAAITSLKAASSNGSALPAFSPSPMMPLVPIHSAHRSHAHAQTASHAVDTASSSGASSSSTSGASSGLPGLTAYESDED